MGKPLYHPLGAGGKCPQCGHYAYDHSGYEETRGCVECRCSLIISEIREIQKEAA